VYELALEHDEVDLRDGNWYAGDEPSSASIFTSAHCHQNTGSPIATCCVRFSIGLGVPDGGANRPACMMLSRT
jgi:hypothetical protein